MLQNKVHDEATDASQWKWDELHTRSGVISNIIT